MPKLHWVGLLYHSACAVRRNLHRLCVLLVLGAWLGAAHSKDLILLEHSAYLGDRDQIEGVAQRLSAQCSAFPIHTVVRINLAIEALPSVRAPSVVISSGMYGLAALPLIKRQSPESVTLWVGHQALDGLAQQVKQAHYPEGIDVIAVPATALEATQAVRLAQGGSCVLRTQGVSHTMTTARALAAYDAAAELIPRAARYLLVVLGGDVQTSDGQSWRYYRVADAHALADEVARRVARAPAIVLVTNGPRTGKFDPDTGAERLQVHRLGSADPVTHAFMQRLQLHAVEGVLYDFQHATPARVGLDALFGALLMHPGSQALLAGESSSMLAQARAVLPAGSVMVFAHGALGATHQRELNALQRQGVADLLWPQAGQYDFRARAALSQSPYQDAASQAAAAVCVRALALCTRVLPAAVGEPGCLSPDAVPMCASDAP